MDLDAQRGARILEERKRLGWSQQAAADAAGIRREMWARYEAGAEPGAKALAGMTTAGVDVYYVLTGIDEETKKQRERDAKGAAFARAKLRQEIVNERLTPRQQALLDNYEAADEAGKRYIERAADHEAQSGGKKAARGGQ